MSPDSEGGGRTHSDRRRLAMIQLAVGGPTFMILVFGLVIAYRVAGRPLGDGVFWAVLGTLAMAFALYAVVVLALLRRMGRSRDDRAD